MRLAIFFAASTLICDGQKYYSVASIFKMLRYFPDFFDIDLICPVRKGIQEGNEVDISGMKLYSIPSWTRASELYLRKLVPISIELSKIFSSSAKYWDAIFIIDADILSQVAFVLGSLHKIPAIIYLRGNASFEIMSRNNKGVRRFLAWLWCRWLERVIPRMLRRSIGVVTGQALFQKYCYANSNLITYYASSVLEPQISGIPVRMNDHKSRELRLLIVGNLVSYKGVDIGLYAIKKLLDKGVIVSLQIVGVGPEQGYLENLAVELGLQEHVKFKGFIPHGEELFHYYKNADALLMPSRTEGTPKVVPEAFSCGLPVIASAVGGLSEMISDGYNGILLCEPSADQFSSAIERLLLTEGLLEKLSSGAYQSASRFTAKAQISHLKTSFEDMLE